MRAPTRQLYHSVSQRFLQARCSVLGPLFWGWFHAETQDRREWMFPTGLPEVSIAGTDPARILIIGDGPAAGFGVRTHQLGIAGHLARQLFDILARGVVVTVAARPAASARSTLRRLGEVELDGYDSIVLMLATTDALCLTTRRNWQRSMTGLVRALKTADAPPLFVTSTASLHVVRTLPSFARRLAGRHARMLDDETRQICARADIPIIPLNAVSDLTSCTYEGWARRIGNHVARSLNPRIPHSPSRPVQRYLRRSGQRTGKASA